MHRSVPLVVLMLMLLLAAVAPASAQTASVTGTVTYVQRIALPPDAVITVQLEDISLADAPSVLIAEQVIPAEGRQVPFPYVLEYDPAVIVDNHSYNVRATIKQGEKLLFISDTITPVITRGAPTENVEIIVVPVAQPEATAQPETPAQPEAPQQPAPATLPVTGFPILPLALVLFAGASAAMAITLHRIVR